MPDSTLRAFADHGQVSRTLDAVPGGAGKDPWPTPQPTGIDLQTITAELEREGVTAFCNSYRRLLDCIHTKLAVLVAASG